MERVLLVEGDDDERVVRTLCDRLNITQGFCIKNKKGIDRLLQSISPELKVAGRLALGILVDANDNPAARWQSIADRIRAAGIAPPESVDSNGTVINGVPRVGIWLMPDNGSPGEIEDFVARLIPRRDPLWPRAERYIDDIPADLRKFSSKKTSRAKLYAWLATRKSPRQMGQAVYVGDLDTDRPIATTFCEWLTTTFGHKP